ncbi:MAG: hypothetical protein ACFB6R_09180 [Alphaproteobacteria bacterium]
MTLRSSRFLVTAVALLAGCTMAADPQTVTWVPDQPVETPVSGSVPVPEPLYVPQIAFEERCPKTLRTIRAQLQDPDHPPHYLSEPVAEVISDWGSKEQAAAALRSEIDALRRAAADALERRSVRDLAQRRQVDEAMGTLFDRHLAAQAMLAAVICTPEPAPDKPATGTRSSRR